MALRDEEGDGVSSSEPVWRVPIGDESTVPSAAIDTLVELRVTAAASARLGRARIGHNAIFTDNCFKRLAAAERLSLIACSTCEAVGA
jgi:hypothetical protein